MNHKKTESGKSPKQIAEETPEGITDLELFQQSVAGARPLKQKNTASHPPHRSRPAARPRPRQQNEPQRLQDQLSDEGQIEAVESGDELLFARPGLQHSVIKKLKRGQYKIDADLDLHGMVVSEAREALLTFLHVCQTERARCVRIVHGKGHGSSNRRPVLKNSLNHWLKQIDEVLAFCSAQPKDGGTGAVYLLLKRGKC